MLVALATSIILARLLGVSDYGYYSLITTLISALSLPVQFGLSQVIIREGSRLGAGNQESKSLIQFAFRASILTSLAGCFVIWVSISSTIHEWDLSTLLSVVVAFALISLTNGYYVLLAMLTARQLITKAQVLDGVARPGMTLVLLLASGSTISSSEFGVAISLAALVVGVGVVVVFVGLAELKNWCTGQVGSDDVSHRSTWLKSATILMLVGGVDVMLQTTDIILVGLVLGVNEVGQYRIGSVLAGILALPLSAATVYASPKIAASVTSKQVSETRRQCIRLARISLVATIVGIIICLLFGSSLILQVYGPDFMGALDILMALSFGIAVNVITGLNKAFLVMKGYELAVVRTLIVTAVINLSLSWAFLHLWGAVGAAVATSISVMLWNLALHVECRRKLGYGVSVFSKNYP